MVQKVFRSFNIRKHYNKNLKNILKINEASIKSQISSNQQIQILSKLSTGSYFITIENLNTVMSMYPLTPQFKGIKLAVRPIHEYQNKSMYLGEWDETTNKKCGRGILLWNDGSKYEGYWFNDKANIKGKLLL